MNISNRELVSALTEVVRRLEDLIGALGEGAAPAPEPQAKPLAAQIEELLRGPDAPLSTDAIAKTLYASEAKVAEAVALLRSEGKIYNLGTEDDPAWWWVIGENTTAAEVYDAVVRLISKRPLEFRQLMNATGNRRTRVSGALIEVQKRRKDWLNLGSDSKYVWFLPPENGGPRYQRNASAPERPEEPAPAAPKRRGRPPGSGRKPKA